MQNIKPEDMERIKIEVNKIKENFNTNYLEKMEYACNDLTLDTEKISICENSISKLKHANSEEKSFQREVETLLNKLINTCNR